jgi:hypothetical protein
MFFVVDKRLLQGTLAIVRDDRTKAQQGTDGPYLRLEARDGFLKLDGQRASAKIAATVYEEGVLFLRVTVFRRLLGTLTGQPFLSIQVTSDGILMETSGKLPAPIRIGRLVRWSAERLQEWTLAGGQQTGTRSASS